MPLWAGLFRHLPIKPVEFRMPEDVSFVWVNRQEGALTGPECERAEQIPLIKGTEPATMTRCLERLDGVNRKSLWRKWFERKN